MKPSLLISLIIFLNILLIFGTDNSAFKGTGEEIQNTGCDLSHYTKAVFKYKAIAFYSQRLVFNSLDDVVRLQKKLMMFIIDCCSPQPNTECFYSENVIFQGRICEDEKSISKNPQALLCCKQSLLEREICFYHLQNNPPFSLPPIDHISNDEQCLAWVADKQDFIESYLHGFSRRLTKFTPSLLMNVFHSFLLIYSKCCEQTENTSLCFSTEKHVFLENMRSKMRLENTMCLMNKYWEDGLGALMFYAKMKPLDPIEKAVAFDHNYMKLASKCCLPESLTPECFETWSGVLFTHLCLILENKMQKKCCLKSIAQRESCLTEFAVQEAETLSSIPVEINQLCTQSGSQLLTWVAYEYSRRNPKKDMKTIRDSTIKLFTMTTNCCAAINANECLSNIYYDF